MNNTHQLETVDRMKSALRSAIDEKPVDYDEFVRHIHRRMSEAVNAERVPAGFRPVNMEDIRRTETSARGHVDYFAKFAFYCAELAMGVEPPR